MDPPDPGAKLPEGSQDKPCDDKGRKEQSPPVPPRAQRSKFRSWYHNQTRVFYPKKEVETEGKVRLR